MFLLDEALHLLLDSQRLVNINIVEEMISIVQAQRAFEMNQKGVQAADEMMRQTNQLQRG